jgi:rare lipoprotein A (peptidoglycan hydrolase)
MVPAASRSDCPATYTLKMFKRAADATYAGTRLPPRGAYGRLWTYAKCQRAPSSEATARRAWGTTLQAWAARRTLPSTTASGSTRPIQFSPSSMNEAVASWYEDGGQTASGFHASYGFASLILGFGTRVDFCYHGRCVVGTDDDHGPYVGGRTFDLNQNLAGALGFDGVDTVLWRVV